MIMRMQKNINRFIQRILQVRDNIQTIKQNIPKLEFKLSNSPDDFNGWLMLENHTLS